eukprot:CCRYP_001327-RA/>CCRYP_001327-RA protein AED:0.06 eAED:0.06 QI:473/1/1/1/0.6/0.33/6/1300/759
MPPPEGETPKLVNRPSNPIIITTEEEEDEVSEKLTAIADDQFVNGGDLGKIDNGTGHSVESREPNPSPESTHLDHAATIGKSMNNEDLHSSYLLAAPVRKGSGNMNFRHQTGNIASFVSKLSSFDFDASHSRRRGSGVLASTADLAASPEVFAQGCTLLQLCAIGNLSKVQSYVATTFNNVNFRDYDRRTGLHVASSEGHLDVVKYLISKGARVNRTDRWGGSPLDDAHRHRHTEVAKYLRAKGGRSGSLNLTSNLINAAATGDIEEVKLIMSSIDDKGVPLDMSASRRKIADSSLGLSRSKHIKGKKSNELDISEPFVFANNDVLDINKGDYDKRTALHLASSEGHYDVVEYLCKHGADVNVTDRWGGKPLDDAVQKGNERIEKLLRKYGATTAGEASHASVRHFSMDLMKSVDSNKNSEAEHMDDDLRVDFDELEMIERIGSGAFGEIYKCRWRGILVAAKCIKASKIQKEWILKNRHMDKSSDRVANRIEMIKQASITEEEKQLALEDFRRETSIMRRLRHPNIVMMLAYSHSDDLEVMISELMKCSLLDIFKANHINNTQIPKRTQVIYAQQLAQGMNHLHKSRPPIIHRDLKPANLLIDFSGTLKIADFGLAKIRPNPEQTEQEAFMMTGETGSYRFMAPEVFRHEEYTESVDVYSYAMIFYYMLRSVAPWPGLSGVDAATKAAVDGERPLIPRDVDQRLATLLKRCWDEDPKSRPSFEEIIRSLAIYSHDVFQTDDREVTLAKEEASCGCVVS